MSQAGLINLQTNGQDGVLEFTGGAGTTGTFPVIPDISGAVSLSSTDGTVSIAGSANAIDFSASSVLLSVSGTLTSAQIKNLNATPIQIIAAPGASKFIQIVSYMATFNYGGSNVFVAAAGQRVALTYGPLGTAAINMVTNSPLVGTNSLALNTNSFLSSTSLTILNNLELYLKNPELTEISGNAASNNTISYNVVYRLFSI
jgi:hypothetical protein